jgi:hypothetical protein
MTYETLLTNNTYNQDITENYEEEQPTSFLSLTELPDVQSSLPVWLPYGISEQGWKKNVTFPRVAFNLKIYSTAILKKDH